jgi:hypothetical protein
MSDCNQSCDGCPSKAEHHLCDACCHDEVDAIQRENRELQEKLEAALAALEKEKAAHRLEREAHDRRFDRETKCMKERDEARAALEKMTQERDWYLSELKECKP